MSYFNSLTLTTKGQEMLLSSNTNIDKKITFTNASLGSEKLLPEEIKGATEIKSSWLKFPLNTVRIINDESNYFLRTEIAFTNTGITESKIMRELGIYAKFENEEEVLFAYSTTDDDGETIPKEDIVPATYKFTIDTTISTETKINQTLSPEGFLTKEVVELLKYYIANIAVQRFKGTLTAGQTIININSEGSLLTTLSKRLQLFIGGELYSEGTDYTVNVENNAIHLNNEFRFQEGTIFEVIDNLPPGYVKELLDEFFKKVNDKELEVLQKLETVQIENIEAIKTLSKQLSDFLDEKNITIIGNLDKKIEEFYLDLDTYIEKNKEKLKGKSLYQSWLDIGNIGSESDFVNAMKIKGDDGDPGRGIVSTTMRKGEGRQRIMTILYTDDTTNELIVEDGQSAYEVWKNIGNEGTEIDFFKSLQGAGLEYSWRGTELGVRVVGEVDYTFVDLKGRTGGQGATGSDGPPGKSAYNIWIELGNDGTEEDFMNSLKGAGIVDKEFIKENEKGDYIYRDIYSDGSKGPEYISPRGPRGYTGGTIGGELPPGNVPYGTIVEWAGLTPPEGWLYTNGGTIKKANYPHMSTILQNLSNLTNPDINIDTIILKPIVEYPYKDIITTSDSVYRVIQYNDLSFKIKSSRAAYDLYNYDTSYDSVYPGGAFVRKGNYDPRMSNGRTKYYATYRRIGIDYIAEIEFPMSLFPTAILASETNLLKGAPETEREAIFCPNRAANITIEVLYEKDGEWIVGAKANNKKDFIVYPEVRDTMISTFNQSFTSNKFRIKISDDSEPHKTLYDADKKIDIFYLGGFSLFFNKTEKVGYEEVLKLPEEKDVADRYKIIFVGQPLELKENTIYSYNNYKRYNGEIPLELAANNKLPSFTYGVTMTELTDLKLGYINKYDSKDDSWSLVKTHEDKEGYYYDLNGDLKYIPKPNNYSIWNFEKSVWSESLELKEKEKQKLLDQFIILEIKKDKMIELGINAEAIETEIRDIESKLEALK